MKLYRIPKFSEKLSNKAISVKDLLQTTSHLESIEITEEEKRSLYKVIKIAEEERFNCGDDDDKDVFNTYMILRKLTRIDGDLSKLKGE